MMKIEQVYFRGQSTYAILGSLVWFLTAVLSFLGVIKTGLIEQLFLLAPLVIIPLGLALIETPTQAKWPHRLAQLIRVVQPIGAAAVILAFLLPSGLLTGALAAVWLAVTGLIALLGLSRFISCWSQGFSRSGVDSDRLKPRLQKTRLDLAPVIEEICLDAGLAYLAVGGGWLVLARLGINPLGFADLIVLLTAIHFHYAGFAAPIITGITGRLLISAPKVLQQLHQIIVFGVIGGTPLVAAGITFSPPLEVVGAIILATSLAGLAGLLIFLVIRVITHRLAQALLTVSAICLIIGMGFTYIYALSEFSGANWVIIPHMVRFHGPANALGFALCGLLAWNILQPQPHVLDSSVTAQSSDLETRFFRQ